ncbi:hypothetical protein K469DRAFT_231262 [Zopfia rhizophila CBS 207.26]|uniref:Uncharacterized protein n=1 Tax=Zopfia rhizophila CBS 207.26 TaxID=1314779 RepID=A0A6A6DWY3_9PEZI|nr:hypothetical protein K469DRAFT_231262 [Zopfia rhizophila CBS 207.26]
MASSFSTLPLAPSLPIKYIPYIPPSLKPKTKSKPKPKSKPSITEHNLCEDGSPEYGGEWADIDDFPTNLLDSNASHSPDRGPLAQEKVASPLGSLHQDCEAGLEAISLQIPQSHQPNKEGVDQAAGVEEMNLAVERLFDGSSPEFPSVLDDDAAGASHSIGDIESGGGPREYQGQDLDAAGMRALSVENTGGVYNDSLPEQDEPHDVDMMSRSSATDKRKYASFADTITSSVELADLTSKPASDDSCSVKRRRLAQPQTESFVPSPVCIPTSTPLPDCGSQISSPRTSSNPNPGFPDSGSKGNSADIPDPPRSDLLDSVNGGDGEHDGHWSDKELLEPLRQSISPPRRMEGDRRVNPDLYVGEVGESNENELNCDEDEPRRASAATSQRPKPSNRPLQNSRRGPSRADLEHQSRSTMPARTLRQPKSAPARRHSRPKADITTRSACLPTSSPGTSAVHNHSTSYGPRDHVDCWPTDITLSQVPKCTTLVTAIVRCHEITSKLVPKPLTVVRDMLGDEGQLIRMMQVTSDSWLLVGCRYIDALNAGRSSTQRSGDYGTWKTGARSPHGKGADNDAVGLDKDEDDRDDEFENSDQISGSETGDDDSDAGTDDGRETRRVDVRTRAPWSKSDEQRLLAYRCKMGMKWDDIYPLFPNRTPGAIQARWYILQGK